MEQLLPLAFLLVVMYFLLIRPQQQRVKAQRSLVSSLTVGDEIVTVGGLIGRIVAIDDETATVETTPGTVLRFRRTAVSGRIMPEPAAEPDSSPISED
ncbi:MAG: preprotein translocase subunit YajC [Actinobacteria bacterium]|nr:preprotein translocase subunit YajC [Actinomycetota bacterium]MBW3649531.1 preprotein translocase subunit YajC [Actinomycetota bacterium]